MVGNRFLEQASMGTTANVVEDDAGHFDLRIKPGKTFYQCCSAGRHATGINNQNDRGASYGGNLGTAPVQAGCADTVKQPHHPFDNGGFWVKLTPKPI